MGEADDMELMYSLIGYPNETEWIEFKTGNNEPNHIGRDISALANSAAYLGRTRAYKLWGVSDDTHTLTGTSFNPYQAKGKGNQDLLIWLRTFLSNHASYEFRLIQHNGLSFVVLEIEPAVGKPVYFDNVAYIREGSSTTRLIAGSAKESKLWMRLQSSDFESKVAERDVTAEEVVEKLDIDTYFSLLDMRVPGNIESILHSLTEQELIAQQDNGRFSILNLGALLIARRLSSFANASYGLCHITAKTSLTSRATSHLTKATLWPYRQPNGISYLCFPLRNTWMEPLEGFASPTRSAPYASCCQTCLFTKISRMEHPHPL